MGIFRRPDRARQARQRRLVDEASLSPAEGARGCELVAVCTPVEKIPDMLRRLRPGLSSETVVVDVGSVKQPVLTAARFCLGPAYPRFVGCHPMAGSEKTGWEHGRADLFCGRTVAITPDRRTSRRALGIAERFWRRLGARPVRVPAAVHDRICAAISHLPHLVAMALASSAQAGIPASERRLARLLVADGFRDTTRVAASDPGLWAQILRSNRAAVRSALDILLRHLLAVRSRLANGRAEGLERFLAQARASRKVLCG